MKTVLIIDDDADDIKFLSTAINQIDASIRCVNALNGQDALELFTDKNNLQADYIFVDLNMPRMNGKECLHKIKSITRLRDIPIILYSTSKLKDNITDALNNGAVYFLTKPTKLSVLKKHVSNILEGKWELINS